MDNFSEMSSGKKRLLIIEDDPSLISLYKQKFENENFVVDTSSDGQAGLQKAQTREYSLIILDLLLPEIDGIEVLKRVRQTAKNSKTPVIILTNLGLSDSLAQQAKALGANAFIIKYNTPLSEIAKQVNLLIEKAENEKY